MFKKKLISFLVLYTLVITSETHCADGTLDTSFGSNGNGTTTTPPSNFGANFVNANAIAAQGSKIIVGAVSDPGVSSTFSVARYTNNGFLDTSFGMNGTQSIIPLSLFGVGTSFAELISIAVQPDNKIIGAGQSDPGGVPQFTLARFTENGLLDSSFGTGGIVTQIIGTNSEILSAILQPNRKIIAGGFSIIAGVLQFTIARFNTNGSLDTSFGTGGIVTQIIGTSSQVNSIAIQSDGKIISGGRATIGGIQQFTIARFNTNGSLDTSFGSGGIVNIPASVFSTGSISTILNDIKIQSNGKIVAGGNVTIAGSANPILVRLNANGTFDNSFNGTGFFLIPLSSFGTGTTNASINSVALQSNGKIITGGSANPEGVTTFAIARTNTNGLLDNSFGMNGTTTVLPLTLFGANPSTVFLSALIINNNKIIATGTFSNNITNNIVLARFNLSFGCQNNIAQAIIDKYGVD